MLCWNTIKKSYIEQYREHIFYKEDIFDKEVVLKWNFLVFYVFDYKIWHIVKIKAFY